MPKENIHVIIRFRPSNKREKKEQKKKKLQDKPILFQNNDNHGAIELCSTKSNDPTRFTFDRILDETVTQKETFHYVAEHVCDDVLDGYNGCIFAYGQTGSGKTYTMFGPEIDATSNPDPQLMGIIPRSVSYIFSEIEEDPDVLEARIKCSFVEIYKEKLRDLLNPSSKKKLAIRLGNNDETRISNLTETHVLTLLDVLQLIEVANSYRTKATTSMNHSSSRSHMLMVMTVATRIDDGSIRVGKLNFCDLAGSEKVRKTNATGNRLKEAQKINLSLTILGQVISSLSENKKHVPYRDSKLTHVLKDSLGGNCKTTLVVNGSKHIFNRDETITALRFGARCKLITNNVQVNKIYSNAELMVMVNKLKKENTALQLRISAAGQGQSTDDILISPTSNKLFNKKINNNSNQFKEEKQLLLKQIDEFKNQINILNTKNHNLQLQNMQLEERRHLAVDTLQKNQNNLKQIDKQIKQYQIRGNQLQQTINHLNDDNEQLRLKIKSLQHGTKEYKRELDDIKKKRHFHQTKLNDELKKFQDVVDETSELMDEILKLKQAQEKSDAIVAAQDNQLTQNRKEFDEFEKQLLQKDKIISQNQTKLNDMQLKLKEYEKQINQLKQDNDAIITAKDDEIETLKAELEKRTQKLTEENHKLTTKIEQREMIQHAYSLRSATSDFSHLSDLPQSKSTSIRSDGSVNSPSSVGPLPPVGPLSSAFMNNTSGKKANDAMLNAQLAKSPNGHGPKMVPTLSTKVSFNHLFAVQPGGGGSSDDISPELIMQSASMHNMQDVINAEQSLMANHEYLQKMETERLVKRRSSIITSINLNASSDNTLKLKDRNTKNKFKSKPLSILGIDLKQVQTDLNLNEIKLKTIKKKSLPKDKNKRMNMLLEIATLEDVVVSLKRKFKNITRKQKKNKKNKSPKSNKKNKKDKTLKKDKKDKKNKKNNKNKDNKNNDDNDQKDVYNDYYDSRNDMITKVSTMDQFEQHVDAALSFRKVVKINDDDSDDPNYQTEYFNV